MHPELWNFHSSNFSTNFTNEPRKLLLFTFFRPVSQTNPKNSRFSYFLLNFALRPKILHFNQLTNFLYGFITFSYRSLISLVLCFSCSISLQINPLIISFSHFFMSNIFFPFYVFFLTLVHSHSFYTLSPFNDHSSQ